MSETPRVAPPRLTTARWFIYSSTGLLVFLCLAVVMAGLILMRRARMPRNGIVTGNSMEPALRGPRVRVSCPTCGYENSYAADAMQSSAATSCSECKSVLTIPENIAIEPGEQVSFMSPRAASTLPTHKASPTAKREQAAQRFDIVVFRAKTDPMNELKRLVGFSNERLRIHDGDLWIDDERVQKTLPELLRQSVLVRHWPNTKLDAKPVGIADWLDENVSPIDNELEINTQSTQTSVVMNDIGIACRISSAAGHWSIPMHLQGRDREVEVIVSLVRDAEQIVESRAGRPSHDGESRAGRPSHDEALVVTIDGVSQSLPHSIDIDSLQWIVIAMVDGCCVVGSHQQEWCRTELQPPSDPNPKRKRGMAADTDAATDTDNPAPPPIRFTSRDALPPIDRCLVFRDIHYRGLPDADEEVFEPTPGLILLGDNVSISNDSRNRWPEQRGRVPTDAIRGIVIESTDPIDSLLKQSEMRSQYLAVGI